MAQPELQKCVKFISVHMQIKDKNEKLSIKKQFHSNNNVKTFHFSMKLQIKLTSYHRASNFTPLNQQSGNYISVMCTMYTTQSSIAVQIC